MERRRQPQPTELRDLLQRLPAGVLLDRMPGAVIGVGLDGIVAYANPAANALLGYTDSALLGQHLSSLLVGYSMTSPQDCVAALRAAGGGHTIDWWHAEQFAVHTVVSTPLLLRATDPFLMVYINDLTELHWH